MEAFQIFIGFFSKAGIAQIGWPGSVRVGVWHPGFWVGWHPSFWVGWHHGLGVVGCDRGTGEMSSGLDHKRDWTRLAKSRPKTGQNCSREGNRGRLKSSFLGFIHFPRKRTLSGWALLFAMGKHTSKEFLCGRKHSRVFECREIRSKSGTKTGLKRGPSRCPKHRKHRYTGKSSFKRGVKMELENATNRPPNERSNARAKSHSERWARDRILVRRALA